MVQRLQQNNEIDTVLDEIYIAEGPLEGFRVKFKNGHAYIPMFGYNKSLDSSVLIHNRFEIKKGEKIEIADIENIDKYYVPEDSEEAVRYIQMQYELNEKLIRAIKQLYANINKEVNNE